MSLTNTALFVITFLSVVFMQRSNLLRLHNLLTDNLTRQNQEKYRKLFFALCWFHAILLERRKFKSLGFNVLYDFTESDFLVCHDSMVVLLDEYPDKTLLEALRYLVGEVNYGGRVTDDWDRKLVNVLANQYFSNETIDHDNYMLSELADYFIPRHSEQQSCIEYIKSLPLNDPPAVFGQHLNAVISSQTEEVNILLSHLIALRGKDIMDSADEAVEEKVTQLVKLLQDQLPSCFELNEVKNKSNARAAPGAFETVLVQEVRQYNTLLLVVRENLRDVERGFAGRIVITPELEDIIASLSQNRVPKSWSVVYSSTKPIGSWLQDLRNRIQQLRTWVDSTIPTLIWLSGLARPAALLTAALQTSARKHGISVDSLNWEFIVLTPEESSKAIVPPEDGIYVKGLYLEGARWDFNSNLLAEPYPMELTSPMPIIHFKPVERKRKALNNMYKCPLYTCPIRSVSSERSSFVVAVDLMCGSESEEHWIKRAVALLLSTSD